MGVYSNSAIGIFLNDNMNVDKSKVKNIQFIIADGGTEDIYSKKYAEWCQLAHDLDIPIIMRYQVTGDGGNTYDLGNFEKGFPDPLTDLQMVAIKRNLSGHLTHGIMLDVTDNTINNGVIPNAVLPEGNYTNLIRWFYENVWTQFKKPMYVYMSQKLIDDSYGKNYPSLMQYTSSDIGMCSWKTATPDNVLTERASWDHLPIPSDSYSPQYIANNGKIYFSRYANSKWTLDGVTNLSGNLTPVPLWKYISSKEGLYADLGFTPRNIVVIPPTSGSTTPPDTTVPTNSIDYSSQFNEIKAMLASISAEQQDMKTNVTATKVDVDFIYSLLKTVFNR